MSDMTINENDCNAVLVNALRSYQHEAWLTEATELSEATGAKVAEIIEGMFSPFCDRLVAHATFDRTPENEAKARSVFFHRFTDLILGHNPAYSLES